MAIYAGKTKQGIIFLANSPQQKVYCLGDCMVASEANIQKQLSCLGAKPSLDSVVEKLTRENKASFVAGKSHGEGCIIRTGKRFSAVISDTSMHTLESSRKTTTQHDGFCYSKSPSIGDALAAAYMADRATNQGVGLQIGILGKKGPVLIAGKEVRLNLGDSSSRSESADLLKDILERIQYIHKKKLSMKASKKLIKKAGEIASSIAGSWTDPVSRTYVDWKTKRIAKQAQEVELRGIADIVRDKIGSYISTARKSITSHGQEVQKELDKAYHSRKRQDIIIRLQGAHGIGERAIKKEIAESLSRALGSKNYYLFDSIPFIAVPCSASDIDKVCYKLNNKKAAYFGASISAHQDMIRSVERAKGFYIPEMFLEQARDMRVRLPYNVMGGLFNAKRRKEKPDSSMWNLTNIGAYNAWDLTCGAGSTVVIIDTGCEYRHSELEHCFADKKGWNFVDDTDDPDDDNGHGTHCAGITAGINVGVAPEARILAAKVLGGDGSGTTTDIIMAIDYAIKEKEADIISMSLGSRYNSTALEAACKEASRSGIIVCAAAGNEYFGPSYPAACEGVISVAAVDRNNSHADFSNIDPSVDISCPGVDIYSSYPKNSYATLSGTSMATPHVAGVGALAVSMNNHLDPDDFEKIMGSCAEKLGQGEPEREEKYGHGLARADNIVKKLHGKLFRYENMLDNVKKNMGWNYASRLF